MNKPMPSPRGTNHERLFVGSKVEAAYDAALDDDGPGDASSLTDDDGKPLVDSGVAHRVLTACIDRLNKTDMSKVVGMLKDGGMLKDDEVRSIEAAMNGGGGESDMASDAAIMSRRRAQVAAGQRPASCLREPIRRQEYSAGFHERFPNAHRLK